MVIAVRRGWAPNGVDRFRELVASRYYDEARIFRIRRVDQPHRLIEWPCHGIGVSQ